MEFCTSDVLKLINLYRQFECLWNYKSASYKRIDLKNNAWQEISRALRKDVHEVKKKMKNLRSCYLAQKKKVESSKKSGSSSEFILEPHLYYFKEMKFLDSVVVLRRTTSNFNEESSKTATEAMDLDSTLTNSTEIFASPSSPSRYFTEPPSPSSSAELSSSSQCNSMSPSPAPSPTPSFFNLNKPSKPPSKPPSSSSLKYTGSSQCNSMSPSPAPSPTPSFFNLNKPSQPPSSSSSSSSSLKYTGSSSSRSFSKQKARREAKFNSAVDAIIASATAVETEDVFTCFAKSIAVQLKQLPLPDATIVMSELQNHVTQQVVAHFNSLQHQPKDLMQVAFEDADIMF